MFIVFSIFIQAGLRRAVGSMPDSKARGTGFDTWYGHISPSTDSRRAVVSYWRKDVHEVLVNRLGGLSLPFRHDHRCLPWITVRQQHKSIHTVHYNIWKWHI